jgi:hypothetical protein
MEPGAWSWTIAWAPVTELIRLTLDETKKKPIDQCTRGNIIAAELYKSLAYVRFRPIHSKGETFPVAMWTPI